MYDYGLLKSKETIPILKEQKRLAFNHHRAQSFQNMNMYDPKNMVRGHKRYYSHDKEQGFGCLLPESKPIF